MCSVIIERVPENPTNVGRTLSDRSFLIHQLGFLEEDIVNSYRLPKESPGLCRPLICELADEDIVAYWTKNGKGRVLNGYTISEYISAEELAESLLKLEVMKDKQKFIQSEVVRQMTVLHDKVRFSKEAQHLFWHRNRRRIPKTILDEPSQWLDRLGEGSYGTVYLYKDEYFQIAVKQIKFSATLVQKEGEDVMKEVNLHKTLIHLNIIRYFGSHQAKDNICIMMEHAQFGSLKSVLLRSKANHESMPHNLIMKFSREIIMGLNYLHTRPKPVIHRDLRSPNVLIGRNSTAKIADFGISKQLNTMASTSGFSTNVGNTYWKSPEYMKDEEVGRKVDIWSLGVTILEMIYVTPPFFKLEQCQWMYRLTTNPAKPPEIPTFVDQRLHQLLAYCLTYDADERKSAEWLLQFLIATVNPIAAPFSS